MGRNIMYTEDKEDLECKSKTVFFTKFEVL